MLSQRQYYEQWSGRQLLQEMQQFNPKEVAKLLGVSRLSFHVSLRWSEKMDTIERIRNLITQGDVRISEHGYDEMAEDGIPVRDIFTGVATAVVVEDSRTPG